MPDDPTPAVVRWFTESWGGSPPRVPGTAGPADGAARRYATAAEYARVRYPGSVGDLVRREILAHEDLAHRFDGSGLIPRVVEDLLSDRSAGRGFSA